MGRCLPFWGSRDFLPLWDRTFSPTSTPPPPSFLRDSFGTRRSIVSNSKPGVSTLNSYTDCTSIRFVAQPREGAEMRKGSQDLARNSRNTTQQQKELLGHEKHELYINSVSLRWSASVPCRQESDGLTSRPTFYFIAAWSKGQGLTNC